MPLTYLLYRCPACGHDPLEGEKDGAHCPECGVRYVRGREGGRIRVVDPAGGSWEVPASRLTAALEAQRRGEPGFEGRSPPAPRRARVRVRQSGQEAPVRWGGELLGFAEAMGEPGDGVLTLDPEGLTLVLEGGEDSGGGNETRRHWAFLDIRAVQTSSSSLQFSPRSGGLVELRFPEDSPRRWETLLREALRWAYREAGLGEIVEFQPRVVTEKP